MKASAIVMFLRLFILSLSPIYILQHYGAYCTHGMVEHTIIQKWKISNYCASVQFWCTLFSISIFMLLYTHTTFQNKKWYFLLHYTNLTAIVVSYVVHYHFTNKTYNQFITVTYMYIQYRYYTILYYTILYYIV